MTRGQRRRASSAAAVAAAAAALGCRSAPTWSALAPDHRTVVTVAARGARSCVVVGARRDGCFDGVAAHTLSFGRRGAHVAYAARVGGRWTVVHDGRPGARWAGVGAPRLSPDGLRVAYPALENGRWRVVVDGVAGEPFDAVLAGTLVFDPAGRRVAYAGRRGAAVHVVVDTLVSEGWSGVGRLAFDSTGGHVAYAARRGTRSRVVVDRWAGPEHDAVGELVVGASRGPSSSGPPVRIAYAARDGGRWRVSSGGAAGARFDSVRAIAHAAGGVVYVARLGDREGVVRGGRVDRWHEAVDAPAFSADGRWGYVARDADSAAVVIGGRVAARAAWAADLAFGHAARLAYLTAEGERTIVVDERRRHAFDLVVAGTLQFVRGGTAWACLAGDRARRELFVVVDGARVGRPFDWPEIVRRVGQGAGAEAVRAWVAAEAERGATGPRAP